MKPFQLPPWRKKQIDAKYARKDKTILFAVKRMERVMRKAVDEILDNYQKTGRFKDPDLKEMDEVSEQFYRRVVEGGFHSAKEEKNLQAGKKRLAKPGPMGIPKDLRSMEKFFRDKRGWPLVLKRSKLLTERLRKEYLAKLRRKFREMAPKLESGEISPKEAKNRMMKGWQASKARVDTIFRTETTNYFARTQVSFFEGDPEIIGFLFDSIRDTSRTEICRSRHGLIYRPGTELLRQNTPACHYQCRSHLIALANTENNRRMLEDPDRDPSRRSVVPLPRGWRK